jgi:UDP-2,3-diacylglucosamine pyrophosphatase LpxH
VVAAVLSDLHLGMRSGADLLRRADVRTQLLERIAEADEVVLLGDSVELRDGRLADSLAVALPFFEALGEAMAGRRVTIVPGNHDHRLVEEALDRPGPLGLEQRFEVNEGDVLGPVARALGDTPVELAYPGIWLRSDVYATHGHYLDCHSTARTFECRARAAVERVRRLPRDGYRTPRDYEAALVPIYRLVHWSIQRRGVRAAALGAKALVRRWERPHSDRRERAELAIPAMRQVVGNLGIGARHVVFGHMHVPGRWEGAGSPELVNAGSWVEAPGSVSPGTCVFVPDHGELRLEALI